MKKKKITNLPRACTCLLTLLLLFITVQAQGQIKVTGTVTDETQETVIGANVVVKDNPSIGTITDMNGKYTIEVPNAKATLVFSFIGYATKEVTVGKNRVIDVVLKEDGVMLNEVVAIGYATVKKSDLTGSVSKVDMDDLSKAPVSSFDQALGGRIAGVQVVLPYLPRKPRSAGGPHTPSALVHRARAPPDIRVVVQNPSARPVH